MQETATIIANVEAYLERPYHRFHDQPVDFTPAAKPVTVDTVIAIIEAFILIVGILAWAIYGYHEC